LETVSAGAILGHDQCFAQDIKGLHSVVIFVPFFIGWALILSRYDFSPFAVFVLFGLTGTLAEMSFGPQHLLEFGLWMFVYGLMVYLPACCVPKDRQTKPVCWWHYPLAIVVPFLFLPLVPLPLLAGMLFPHHPRIHFPPDWLRARLETRSLVEPPR
jgi:hypothetical protein